MVRFIKQLVLFSIPLFFVIAVFGFFYFVGWQTGEFKNLERSAIRQQEDHRILLGYGYNEETPYYKQFNANRLEADIITVGTSRVMPFRDMYFNKSFYNCGGCVSSRYDEYTNYLKNLTYTPKMVIVGLDLWVFNKEREDLYGEPIDTRSVRSIQKEDRSVVIMTTDLMKDYLKKKWTFSDLRNYPFNVGMNGVVKGAGFRYDGSYCYGDIIHDPNSTSKDRFEDMMQRLQNGTQRFEYGEEINEETVKQLEILCNYCEEKNIELVTILMPLAPSIYDKMVEMGTYGYMDKIAPVCGKIVSESGFEFWDYLDGELIDLSDEYYTDGFHGGEIVYAKMLQHMIDHGSVLADYVDREELDKLMDNAENKLSL